MESSPSSTRKLFPLLFASAIQRCRLSGALCRLSVSLKCFLDSHPPSVTISISDTGVGSSLAEFQDLLFPLTDNWEGLLSITTTGIHDKDVNHYRMNVGEAVSPNRRLTRLLPTRKGVGTFSGTEVCFSTREENVGDLVTWIVHFVKKFRPNRAAEGDLKVLSAEIHLHRRLWTPEAEPTPSKSAPSTLATVSADLNLRSSPPIARSSQPSTPTGAVHGRPTATPTSSMEPSIPNSKKHLPPLMPI